MVRTVRMRGRGGWWKMASRASTAKRVKNPRRSRKKKKELEVKEKEVRAREQEGL